MKMKKLIAILTLFCGICFIAKAQTFAALPGDSIVGTYNVNDWASDYIYLRNNSGSPLALSFQTITNTMTSNGWDVVLCTNDGCFSYVPSSGTLGSIGNGDSAYLHVQCGFIGNAGTCEIRVRVFETGNPSNADTLTFRYTANSTIGMYEHSAASNALSQNFPNPFSTFTTIGYSLDQPGGQLVISDVSGKTISVYVLNNNVGEIRVEEDLAPGVYFYSLYGDGLAISTRRMIVQ